MADTAGRAAIMSQGRRTRDPFGILPHSSSRAPKPGRRHPLVAAAIVLPLATLLVVIFGGWEAVVTQASSVAGTLGR